MGPARRGDQAETAATPRSLLSELVDGLLLLVDLVPEPGQLPVMGLPVALHLQLQRLLQHNPTQVRRGSQPPAQ